MPICLVAKAKRFGAAQEWPTHDALDLHSRKLTWKPKKGPIKTTVLLQEGYMGFHVSLGECKTPTMTAPGRGILPGHSVARCSGTLNLDVDPSFINPNLLWALIFGSLS